MKFLLISAVAAAILAACGDGDNDGGVRTEPVNGDDAFAYLDPLTDDGPVASARFRQTNDGVRIIVRADGLVAGIHGMYIGEGADCETPGPHFNPAGARH